MIGSQHHYEFAHIALREVCQGDPLAFFNIIDSPLRNDFLGDIWRNVRENCDADGNASFDLSDIGITTCRIKSFPAIIVAMPPPAETAQAHFVAIVLKIDTDPNTPPVQLDFGYLTLEKGTTFGGSERTVLCGWRSDGAHMNYGDGPAATQESFIAAVGEMI
ncbi:MAG: hypothetical protein ACI9X0_002715 [Kiritimatiellia bacterium]|jgi:hypothetical protein